MTNMLVHKSTYLDVPKNWLGESIFFRKRSILKSYILISIITNISAEVTGTGGEIFDNLEVVKLSDEEDKKF